MAAADVCLAPSRQNGHRLKRFARIYASLAASGRADVENRPAATRKPVFAMINRFRSALLDQAGQQADFPRQLLVALHEFLNLADGVQNG
jgi:hypothetical protein